jgi:ABC transport system ATP-binding/permease protein
VPAVAARPARTNALRLNFNEQRELAALPARIEALETETAGLRDRFAHPDVYREGAAAIKALQDRLTSCEAELAEAYARWETLESRNSALAAGSER